MIIEKFIDVGCENISRLVSTCWCSYRYKANYLNIDFERRCLFYLYYPHMSKPHAEPKEELLND